MFPGQKKGFCIHGELLCECSARSNIDWSKQTYCIPQPLLWPRGLRRPVYVSGNSDGIYLSATSIPKPTLSLHSPLYPRVVPDNIPKYQVVPLVPGILCRRGPFQ